jgi:hypothetical protein
LYYIIRYILKNKKFYQGWQSVQEARYFNCWKKEIEKEIIDEELTRPDGRRAFHPFFKKFRR